jgi:hypothetical protein
LPDAADVRQKSAPYPIHLVHKADAGHAVAIGLAPDRLRLGFHAGHAIKDDDAAVEDAQTALHLGRKVNVPRRVDDVDLMVAPGTVMAAD